MSAKRNNLMQNPKMYLMLKDKEDGLRFGTMKYPCLFAHTTYMFPSDIGSELVKDGYAQELD